MVFSAITTISLPEICAQKATHTLPTRESRVESTGMTDYLDLADELLCCQPYSGDITALRKEGENKSPDETYLTG